VADPEEERIEPHPEGTRPELGRRHEQNRLNDLTGREWLYFLNSVETTAYPTSGPEAFGHNLRREHPSPKPPQLMARLIRFFTRQGGWVLDPFAGVGGTLLGCAIEGRRAVGIELWPRWVDIYRQVCAQEGLTEQTMLVGDARDLADVPAVAERRFDLILTDPPYGEMLSRPQSGERKKRTGRVAATPFSPLPEDLGNLPREG
jgi:DNA modification methylase